MKEKELQAAVIEAMHRHGWLVAHFYTVPVRKGDATIWMTPAQADGKGFPDIVAVRERMIMVELKIHPNKPSPEQENWGRRLAGAGVEIHLWTDRDWVEGLVDHVLKFRHDAV